MGTWRLHIHIGILLGHSHMVTNVYVVYMSIILDQHYWYISKGRDCPCMLVIEGSFVPMSEEETRAKDAEDLFLCRRLTKAGRSKSYRFLPTLKAHGPLTLAAVRAGIKH